MSRKKQQPKLDTRDVRTINKDLRSIITWHNLYFKETKQAARFNKWLSNELGIPVEKYDLRQKINYYFTSLFRALRGL